MAGLNSVKLLLQLTARQVLGLIDCFSQIIVTSRSMDFRVSMHIEAH